MTALTPEEERLEAGEIEAALRRFVDDYRSRCLWFLRPDYYPRTPEEIQRTLRHVEHTGDRAAFLRAAALRRCLSLPSNATSAGS